MNRIIKFCLGFLIIALSSCSEKPQTATCCVCLGKGERNYADDGKFGTENSGHHLESCHACEGDGKVTQEDAETLKTNIYCE